MILIYQAAGPRMSLRPGRSGLFFRDGRLRTEYGEMIGQVKEKTT